MTAVDPPASASCDHIFIAGPLALEPADAETNRLLGEALMLVDDLMSAAAAFPGWLHKAGMQNGVWGGRAARTNLGDVLVSQGDEAKALAAFRKAWRIRGALATRDQAKPDADRHGGVLRNRLYK